MRKSRPSLIDNMQAAATMAVATAVATTVAAAALLSMAYLFFIQSIKWNPHSFHQHISGIQIAWIPFYSKWEFFFAFFQTFACPLSLTVCIAYGLHIQLKYQKNIFIYNRNFRLFLQRDKKRSEREKTWKLEMRLKTSRGTQKKNLSFTRVHPCT